MLTRKIESLIEEHLKSNSEKVLLVDNVFISTQQKRVLIKS